MFYKSFQLTLFEKMDIESDNYEDIYCPENGEYRT